MLLHFNSVFALLRLFELRRPARLETTGSFLITQSGFSSSNLILDLIEFVARAFYSILEVIVVVIIHVG